MKTVLPKVQYISSIENASIIRKFFTLFMVSSIIPLLILFQIFVTNFGQEEITISSSNLAFTLFFATLGILTAFIGMRSALQKITRIHTKGRSKAGQEQNEIDELADSFASIQKRLEEGLRDLEKIKNAR